MIAYVFRRLLWTIPTLIGVSLVSFLLLSFIPDPTDEPAFAAKNPASEVARIRRERFLDLPRFLNVAPRDIRARVETAIAPILADDEGADGARRELARLGGAALPFVLPFLDSLSPERRVRLALALSPIAQRMGISEDGEVDDPGRAAAFWARFWDDRGIEFRRAGVHSARNRLLRYGSALHATDLIELDTFVLPELLDSLSPPTDATSLARARVLIDVAAHVTGRDDRIALDDNLAAARACVGRWQEYWAVYRSDYVPFMGMARVAAVVLETRYGKWALGVATQRFGRSAGGTPVLDELVATGPVTLAIMFGAIALAYAIAVPLGAIAAATRGRAVDVLVTVTALALYAMPTAAIAVFVQHAVGHGTMALAILVLAAALIAVPTAQHSAALALALSQGYVYAATARGASRLRVILVHSMRNALLPVATLATLEGPMALGGAFVVERIFHLRGVGEVTIRAVQQRDIDWLMAISTSAAVLAAFCVLGADLACALLDPRLREPTLSRRARS